MNVATLLTSSDAPWNRAALALADMAVKGVPILLLAAAAAWLLRRRSAAARHLTWQLALAALLALPAVSPLAPRWRVPLLPAAPAEPRPLAPVSDTTTATVATTTVPPTAAPTAIPTSIPDNRPEASPARTPTQPPPVTATRPIPVAFWVLAGWLTGAVLVLGKLAAGLVAVAGLRRKAAPVDDEGWTTLRADLSRAIGLRRATPLLRSPKSTTPMAVGLLRPAILLPAESDGWPDEKRRMVLLHELAHVRRRDGLTNAIAHVAVALHWFDPLAWLALRRLTIERERACDDTVLSSGSVPSRYAGCLLDIARDLHAGTFTAAAAIPMARPTQLEGRLLAILDAARPRRAATRRAAAAGLAVTAMLLLPLAAVRLTAATPDTTKGDAAVYKPIVPEGRPTTDINGVVADEAGQPVPNVKVLAIRGWDDKPERRTAETDAGGRFSFKDLKPDYWYFSVNDPRYAWMWDHENGLEVPAKPHELPVAVTPNHPRTMKGTVVDDAGQPVANARVVLVNQIGPGQDQWAKGNADVDLLTTRTDGAGRFTLDRLRAGKAVFALEHPDYAVTFAKADVDGHDHALTIEKGLTVHGRVTTPDGKPVAGVSLRAGINEAHRPTVRWRGKSDADGRFEVPHVPARAPESRSVVLNVTVSIQDPAWYSDYYNVFQVSDRELAPTTIIAKPKEPGKKPTPVGVDVGKRMTPATATTRATQHGTVRVHVPGLPAAGYAMVDATSPVAGEDYYAPQMVRAGTAVFDGLPPGQYVLTFATDQDTPARLPKTVELRPGQTLDVTLEPGPARIHGVVRSGSKPVGTGTVAWYKSPPTPGRNFMGDTRVRPDGTYAIDGLAEGTYRLVYNDLLHTVPSTFTAQATGGAAAAPFDLELPTGRIEGKLVGIKPKEKDPKEKWHLGEIFARPRGVVPMNGNQGAHVDAAPDGSFTVDYLAPGQYVIDGYGLVTATTIEREGDVATATLRPPEKSGQIAGTLTGHLPATEGLGPPQVVAFPRDDRGYDFGVWTYMVEVDRKDNSYRLRNLPPGTYGVFVRGLSQRAEFTPLVWIPNIEVRDGLARELVIDIPEGRMVHLDARAAGPTLKSWRMRMPSGDWLDAPVFTANNLGGKVELPLGEYELEADHGKQGTTRQKFTVERGEGPQAVPIEGSNAK